MSHFRKILLLLGMTLFCPPAFAQEKTPVRVGVLGVDNYQCVEFAQMYNSPKATGDLAGLRVVAAYPDTPSEDIEDSVKFLPMWQKQIAAQGVKIVDSIDELLKQCDAVMIMNVDGRKHRAEAEKVLKAGKRLFIGRPMAAKLEDVAAIFKIAEETKTPVWSSSQHRYSPGFIGMKNHAEVGKVTGCDVYGGCPMHATHPDLTWHALHSIETLYAIMGPGCETVACVSTPTTESITGTWSDGRVGTYRGIKKGAVKYSATVFGDKGVSVAGIYGHGVPVKGVVPTNDEYMGYKGIGIEMAKFLKGGAAPVTPAETLEVFAFIDAAHESKRRNGAPVRIREILDKVK